MKNTIISICNICILLICSQANSATQVQIDKSWNNGLAWMMLHQHSDGGWSDQSGLGPQATAEFIKALSGVTLKGNYTFLGGLSWLSNAEMASIDALSRQSDALFTSGENTLPFATKLLAWRNIRKAWGAYPQYETSLPDTPLAIMSLIDAQGSSYSNTDLANAVCQFLPSQLPTPDYLWPYSAKTGSMLPYGQRNGAIIPTVYAIQALNKINTGRFTGLTCGGTSYTLTTVINNAITGLLTKRKSDNGFGDGTSSTITETALVYRVLKTLRPSDPATGPALDYLLAQQASNGSWNDNVYFSAVVLASLPIPTAFVDTDKDGIPDGVETAMGKNPAVVDSRFLATGSSQTITTALLQRMLASNSITSDPSRVKSLSSPVNEQTGINHSADIELFIAGSAAELGAFEAVIDSLFSEKASLDVFYDDNGKPGFASGGNYRAYLGVIDSTSDKLLDGKRLLIHFRAKGGSYNGVGPLVFSTGIEHMTIDENCSAIAGGHIWSCPMESTATAIPDAGISEGRPEIHIRENAPKGAIDITPQDVSKLDSAPLFKGLFGIAASDDFFKSGRSTITRKEVADIYAGKKPKQFSGHDVIACKMQDGAQPAANKQLFDIPCAEAALIPAQTDSTSIISVENTSQLDVISCLNTAHQGGTLHTKAGDINVGKNSIAVSVLPLSYKPYSEDTWNFTEPSKTNGKNESLIPITLWMQWNKGFLTKSGGETKILLLKEIRKRLQSMKYTDNNSSLEQTDIVDNANEYSCIKN